MKTIIILTILLISTPAYAADVYITDEVDDRINGVRASAVALAMLPQEDNSISFASGRSKHELGFALGYYKKINERISFKAGLIADTERRNAIGFGLSYKLK